MARDAGAPMQKSTTNSTYRSAVGMTLLTAGLLFWINGAVGIIGADGNPANLLYGGVLAIGILGALLARLEPLRMARVLLVTALAQVAVPVIALGAGFGNAAVRSWDVLFLTAFFVVLWIGSALLFRKAGRRAGALSVGGSTGTHPSLPEKELAE